MAPNQEIALRAVGTALAGVSIAFAGYMVVYGGGKIRVNGIEHLAIFAQPRGSAADAIPSDEPAPPSTEDQSVDMTTTGSIAAAGRGPAPMPRPIEIVAARADRVWLRIDGSIRAAVPGDTVPGVGRIAAIAPRDGGWALLDDKGATLLSVANRANGASLFARKMIFE
jgi:hypothetical protein